MKLVMCRKIASVVVILTLLSVTACGTRSGKDTSSSTTSSSAVTQSTTAEVQTNDPMGKYEPAIDITVGRTSDSTYKFVDGESFDKNIWMTEYKDTLGINIKHDFIVDATQYDAKVNVTIASGEIPDLMLVTAKQTKMLMDADMIYEMSDVFAKYASPMSNKAITSDAKTFTAAKIEGKLMGIPMIWAVDFALNDVWVRSDWMKELNLQEPKTAQDFIKIAEAFKNQDPDGNGKADTFGISLDKLLPPSGLGVLSGWLNMFHAYRQIWLKDASGNLVYSSIQPEMKVALQKMAELYKSGVIDREFGVKDSGKIAQDVVSEKVGMVIGAFWLPAYPFQDLKNKNPKSDWTAYPILSSDDKPALSQVTTKVDQFFVVSKECKNPEAVVKMLNLDLENLFGSRMVQWTTIAMSDKYKDLQTFKYPVIGMEPPTLNRDWYDEVQSAIESKDESKLTQGSKNDWENSQKYINGDVKGYNNYKIRYEKLGGMGIIKQQLESGNIMYNEFLGIPGTAAVEKTAAMDKLENEVFTKIIMNTSSINEFDKFVEQWKKIGGDDVTKEVNDWYLKNK